MNSTRRRILALLADGPISGPDIAERLDVTRAAVWKHVDELREAGFEIESDTTGYRLESVPEYNGPAIEFGLQAPFSVEYHESVSSTNRLARERAEAGTSDHVVVADTQTGGRGRLDRSWESPSGGIWSSVIVRPDVPPRDLGLFTLAGAVAAANTAREFGVDARMKWPNDVVLPTQDGGYRKLAGVLTEMSGESDRIDWLVIGIGLNANVPADGLPSGATSLLEERGEPVDRRIVLQRLLERFDSRRADPRSILTDWRELTITLDRQVIVRRERDVVEGTAVDVSEHGGLIVETDHGLETVYAGDCELLRAVDDRTDTA